MSTEHLRLLEPAPPKVDPLIGQVIEGRYRIERLLGEGGMGVVYKATHAVIGKACAIKVLRGEVSRDAEVVARFKQEAQSASAIGNEHIIDITDFGVHDGATYFVMEFLDGFSLSTTLEKDRPLTCQRTIEIGKQLCDALGAAHERGIVHRDLKPDNVYLIKRHGTKDFVKVLDFGIAKVGGATSKLTKAGQVFGTPHYMSPEQCAGTSVDQRTDVYAVGVMMYEMASGRVPFDADNLMGILTKHLYENPIPPRELPPPTDLSPGLEAIIMKALSKKPETRYQSMAEMHEDLERAAAGTTTAAVLEAVQRSSSGGTVREPTGRTGITMGIGAPDLDAAPPKRSMLPLVLGGLAVLLVLGGGLGLYLAFGRPSTTPIATVGPTTTTPTPTGAGGPGTPNAPPVGTNVAGHPVGVRENPTAVGSGTNAPVQPPATPRPANISTTPPGATVLRDGVIVCSSTPCAVPLPTGADIEMLDVRLEGHQSMRIALSAVSDPTVALTLEARRRGERDRVRTVVVQQRRGTGQATRPPANGTGPFVAVQTPTTPATAPTTPATNPETPRTRPRQQDPDDLRIRQAEVVDPWATGAPR